MKTNHRMAIPVAALLAAAGQTAAAEDVNVQSLISPSEQSLELGVLGALGQHRATGSFNGMTDKNALPILNGAYINRDEATGTWTRAVATDIGLDGRELLLAYERQGNWKVFLDLNQLHKTNPLKVTTGLTGIGTANQTVNGTTARRIELETDRYNGKLGFAKSVTEKLDVQISFRNEKKDGDRHYGYSTRFLAEPIDFTTREIDASVSYRDQKLNLAGGFLGSFFENKNQALYSAANANGLTLPPDNEAYNFYLKGGYAFTPQTRANFKLSHTLMTQTESFFYTPNFAGNTRTDAGGKVKNYLASANINSRVTDDLSLVGRVRYFARRDKTPVEQYITATASRSGFNDHLDRDTTTVEGEATYRLPDNYRLTGIVKYEGWDRTYPLYHGGPGSDPRQASWRAKTDEYSGRLQIAKQLRETLGGKASYLYSERDGSAILPTSSGSADTDPIHWADRNRHQVRLGLDWVPDDNWSVQGMVDGSFDSYDTPELPRGPQTGTSTNAAVDVAYRLDRNWNLTGFISRNEVTRRQLSRDQNGDGDNIQGYWGAKLKNLGYSVGVGAKGTPRAGLKVGIDLVYSRDRNEYKINGDDPGMVDLPDVTYNRFDLKLSAEYALSSNGSVWVGYNFTHLTNGDFGYDVNVYTSDDTVIALADKENSHFVGISYKYRW